VVDVLTGNGALRMGVRGRGQGGRLGPPLAARGM
jgi:hypothetical protein